MYAVEGGKHINNWNIKADGRQMTTGEIVSTVLTNRGILDTDNFLNPRQNSLLPFTLLKNIDVVANAIIDGINNNKSFLIHFDVDVDGCTAGAIMYRYLKYYTNNVYWQINQGKKHGIADIKLNFIPDILIIVDSINECEHYKPLLKQIEDILIIDHHIVPQSILSSDIKLVSSANDYPNSQLSGSGVTWKVCKYIDSLLLNDYADNLVDLAACGIIADMCAVDEQHMENRYICSQGFANLINMGIKKINGSYKFNSQAVSFGIAPLINAACRLNKNEIAVLLFISDDTKEISRCIKELKTTKECQNLDVSLHFEELCNQAEQQKENNVLFFLLDSETDIAGLIANKLLEKYGKPCFVLKRNAKGYSGSCRAKGVKNFKELVDNLTLAETGGHENAFGISIDDKYFDSFKNSIIKATKDLNFETNINIDIQLNPNQIDLNLINMFKNINIISGQDFAPITVLISGVDTYKVSNLSQGKHLRIISENIDFIEWNFTGDFNEFDNLDDYVSLSFIGVLDCSFFGRKLCKQLIVNDYAIERGLDI